jgi:DNA-binding transcriptional LysR family regulator
MNTRDLEAFLAVVDGGSIMAAAARLHLTQPAVTRRIQGLEQALGIELLDRVSKPLRPTRAGREAYELGRRVLESVQELRSGLAEEGVGGELRFGVTPSQSDESLCGPLDALRRAHPNLALHVTTGWSQDLLDQVEANRIDAALVHQAGEAALPAALAADPIERHRAIVVAPKGLLTRRRAALADLAEQPWVLSQDGCGFRRVIRQALAREGLPFVVAVETLNSELRLSLIARGLGVGVTTDATLARSRHRALVDVLDLRDFKAEIRSWLVHRPTSGRLAAPLAHLADSLRTAYAKTTKA